MTLIVIVRCELRLFKSILEAGGRPDPYEIERAALHNMWAGHAAEVCMGVGVALIAIGVLMLFKAMIGLMSQQQVGRASGE